MLFNSSTFLVFFAVVLAVHYSPISWRLKKHSLLWASYLFYAAWNPPFVVLLWLSTLVDWTAAQRIAISEDRRRKRAWLVLSLVSNLGLLAFFKYGNFALENLQALLSACGVVYQPPALDILLPVGISFYTFQTLSYTLDVYFGRAKPWHSFLDFALYVTFFPQLVAGPIVRATCFLPQCVEPRRATRDQFGWGLMLLLLGLFQKVVVADALLAPIVDQVYGTGFGPSGTAAWQGTVAFAGQIFCDFAGYSSCAIGAAMCLGFSLPENFRFPYAAIGFSDFWRRWHISLSTWLRDYLYVPLGGNRRGAMRTHGNLMATMLIGGLWHGASWTFVVWGGLHGAFLVVERWLRRHLPERRFWSTALGRLALGAATFACVCLAWVFFRAESFDQAWEISTAMLGFGSEIGAGLTRAQAMTVHVVMGALLLSHAALRNDRLELAVARLPHWSKALFASCLLVLVIHSPGDQRAFLYFQF
ncbi:MAG: MBOAT family protein [Planctomycetes bacterium]|nr:MBOAT family protein [Planctomycetota bacterium]